MDMLRNLKARFPKLLPAVATVLALATAGGVAVHEYLGGNCCAVGSSCCHPGSPCCGGAHRVAQK